MRFSFLLSSPCLLVLTGCSALVNPDESELARVDTGPVATTDSGVMRIDAGPGPTDAGPARDGGPLADDGGSPPTDSAPPPCTDGMRSCDGDFAVVCVAGVPQRTACPHGCDPGTMECAPPPMACPGVVPIAIGDTLFVDLCGTGDDESHVGSAECTSSGRADGEDRVFTFTLATEADILVDMRDADGSVAIDTIAYIRSRCGNPESQVACSDDILCSESDIMTGCMGGLQVRQSRIRTHLAAGAYYLYADSFDYRTSMGGTFACGTVRLSLTTP